MPIIQRKQGWHLRRTKSKNRTKCLQEWVSYQDREWCCTPGIPVPAPDRSDPRTWALGWCMFSCGCGSPGCSPCCTATRRSRTTSHRSRCSRRSFRGGERLLCGKSVDRVTVLSILSGYNVIPVRFSISQGCCINKVELNYVHLFWEQRVESSSHFRSVSVSVQLD